MGQVPRVGTGGGATREDLPFGAVERGLGLAASLVRGSVSMRTWQAYSRVWKQWEELLDGVGGCGSGEDLEGAALYFVGLAFGDRLSFSGVSQRMAAVAFWCKLKGRQDATKSFLVRQALKGYRKQRGRPDLRRPVSFEMLGGLCQQVQDICASPYEVLLFRAAFSLAFFGAFRISELVAANKRTGGGLLRDDVQISEEGLSCFLRKSKTDQLGQGRRVCLYRLPGTMVCPVRCVEEFLGVRLEGGKVLLVHQDGSSLSRFQFLAIFRRCLRERGFQEKEFCTHSFRIGAATQAARWGLDDEVIKRIGRWESVRFRSYVRPQLL